MFSARIPNIKRLDTRRFVRKDSDCDATIQIGDIMMSGKVLDYSPGGVFFTPEVSYIDGDFIHGNRVLKELCIGGIGHLLIQYKEHPVVDTRVHIRWVGRSDRHQTRGAGFENKAVDIPETLDCLEALEVAA